MKCKICGNTLADERAELGYDYCTNQTCVDECLEGLDVVAVHVNKASDQYVLRRHLEIPKDTSTRSVDPGWAPFLARPAEAETTTRPRRQSRSTQELIDELEADLDKALAEETDPRRRNKLVNDYNASLRRFDIRYRRLRQRRS